ncbi:expansin-like A1 [Hibiscus syriacus]|uniref:expansin-like A1 n=1 Tax=Hibiscus syriacus TaxID=106335 RepID=UPI001921ADC4|nr:expansin-like A1 [Hibiscus syriacus]
MAVGLSGGSSLYKDGAGCGACFQVRCKNSTLCSCKGTRVTLTDINHTNETDFVLGNKAFMAMANHGMGQHISKLETIDVKNMIPCGYRNQNLAVRVEESSEKPNYLAIKLLYQGGQTKIVAIDVAQVNPNSKYCGVLCVFKQT